MTEAERKKLEEIDRELLILLEAERKDQALQDYSVFAEEYIKITDKKGNQVNFVHNPIQKKLNDKIKELHAAGIPVRLIILKGRQHGVTTDAQGRMIKNTTTKENRNGFIVAHEIPATNTIFEKTKYMFNNLPPNIKPLTKASNARELVFDRPTGYKGAKKGLNSKIEIQVAGDIDIGRSKTLHYVHLSEFAFWPSPEGQEPLKQLSSIMNAVADSPDTEVVIESTANGYNDFKTMWDETVAGNNEWVPMFFPWHDNPEYAMQCTPEDYERAVGTLKADQRYYLFGEVKNGKKYPGVVELYKLSREQIRWWISTLKNKCNNDLKQMKQENPSMPDDAFMATGTPVFDVEKVKMRIEYLKQIQQKNPPKKGHFYFEWNDPESKDYIKDNTIKWVEDKNGFVTIYEFPTPGFPYVLGGDTKGEGRDFYAGKIINNVTGRRSAAIRYCWTNSKPYTWQMYCLGMFYNLALLGIEVNFNTAPIEELERLHYPRQYQRRQYDSETKEYQNKHGWKTDGNTRPLIIDKEIHLIEDNIDLFEDIEMLNECLTFVYDKKGRPDAMSGKHDDALFADMIANEIRSQQSFEAERDSEIIHRSFDSDTERYEPESESPFD